MKKERNGWRGVFLGQIGERPPYSDFDRPVAAELHGLRIETVEAVLSLMSEAGMPLDECVLDTIFPHSNGYSTWFISLETVFAGLTTPMTAEEIVGRIEARLQTEPKKDSA